MLSKNYKEVLNKNFHLKQAAEYGLVIFAKYYKVNGGYSEMSRIEKERLDSLHFNLTQAGVFRGKNTSWEDFGTLYKVI